MNDLLLLLNRHESSFNIHNQDIVQLLLMVGPENHWITRQAIKLAIQNTRYHRYCNLYWMIKK